MKLIIENFKQYLEDDEFAYNHNLFLDFIKNDLSDKEHPEYVEYFKNYSGESRRDVDEKANAMMHRFFKFKFPYDVAASKSCREKLVYLNELVESFYENPKPMDTMSKPPPSEMKESLPTSTIYTKCYLQLDAERKASWATYDDMKSYETYN